MTEEKKRRGEQDLKKHLEFVYEAGHGSVEVEVADGVIVNVKSQASQQIKKGER